MEGLVETEGSASPQQSLSVPPPLGLSAFSSAREGTVKDRIPEDQRRLEQLLSEAQAANLRLTATVSFLEEQNRLLMGENTALSESLSVFIRTGSGAPSSPPSSPVSVQESEALKEATALLKEKSSATGEEEGEWLWASNLSGRVDAFVGSLAGRRVRGRRAKRNILMLNAIESLSSLVHLSTTLAGPEDTGAEAEEVEGGGDDERAHELDVSLKHALFEATHILCEVLLDPAGRETSELLEPFPNQWLLNSFPFPRVPAPTQAAAAAPAGTGTGEGAGTNGKSQGAHPSPSSPCSSSLAPATVVSAGVGKGADCWLPLHWCAAARDPDPINIDVLSEELSQSAFAHSVSPLSIAVAKGRPSTAAVVALVQRNRDLFSLRDEDGSVPLMHACSCNEETEVVQFLYEANPSTLVAQDNAGFRAINYAAYSGYSSVVSFLLSAQPKVASMAAKNGSLALHDAAENGLRGGLSMVDEVFQANTSALLQADDDGALPMHRAARGGSLEVVQYLHGLFPKALTMEDREGLLPLHYASQRGDRDQDENLKIVQYLVQKT